MNCRASAMGRSRFQRRTGCVSCRVDYPTVVALTVVARSPDRATLLWHGLLTVPLPRPQVSTGCGDLRSGAVARSGDRATTRHSLLWHGLLTVPLPPTAGLHGLRETFGQEPWHGQET